MVYDPAIVTEKLIEERWALATEPKTLEIARRMYSTAAFAAGAKAAAASDATPYWAQLHKITAPVLLTWGRDDRVSPVDMAMLPMRELRRGELHVFPNCGHWTMIERARRGCRRCSRSFAATTLRHRPRGLVTRSRSAPSTAPAQWKTTIRERST